MNKPESSTDIVLSEDVTAGEGIHTSLIPLTPKPGWPSWGLDYLREQIRLDGKGRLVHRSLGAASNAIGVSYQAVYLQRLNDPAFGKYVEAGIRYRDTLVVDTIEDVTLARAIKSDPEDRMSATLGLAHLKARDSRYKDNAAPIAPTINITVGFTIGQGTPRFVGAIDADHG